MKQKKLVSSPLKYHLQNKLPNYKLLKYTYWKIETYWIVQEWVFILQIAKLYYKLYTIAGQLCQPKRNLF